MKKIGNKVIIRGLATYNYSENTCYNPNSRFLNVDEITKVFSHGVRTKRNGYVNNKRILSYEL